MTAAAILADVEGSDHCPVTVDLNCEVLPGNTCPPLCTKFMPEFSGKQQKLSTFFTKLTSRDTDEKLNGWDNGRDKNLVGSGDKDSGVAKGLKRSPSKGLEQTQASKKPKTDMKKSGSKQGNLMAFFKVGEKSVKESQASTLTQDVKNHSSVNQFKISAVEINKCITQDTSETSKYFSSPAGKEKAKVHQDNVSNGVDAGGSESSSQCSVGETGSVARETSQGAASAWKNLLGGLGPAPLCKGHNEPCVLRMVKKPGPNKGKQFYTCNRGEGLKTNPEARCNTFLWVEKKKIK